ncbi:MAG TPA: hypothetical protein PLC07_04120 [Bacillota bacterium]|nr:hypothetical protein [Bacillota bacterium]HPT86516.1 hypothetical protein [Bacillota bacterium]
MKLRWAAGIFAFLLLLSWNVPAWAKGDPVTLKADRIEYEDHSRQLEAWGHVQITYKDIKILSDHALLDRDLKMLVASGNVQIEQGEDSFQGEQFIYDIRTEQGWVTPIFTEVTDSRMEGPAYFSAVEGLVKGDDLFLKNSSFTSCNLAEPHYRFTAERVEYYPEDRIVFYQMWYWEGKYRILYFPYYVISLKEDDSIFDVKIGYETDTGWYLYVGYNYYLNARNKGTIYTKLTQWGGDGIGIKNTTKYSEKIEWYQDFFYKDNSDNDAIYNEYKLAFGYKNETNSKMKWKVDVENWYTDDLEGSGYSKVIVNIDGISPYPTLRMSYKDDKDEAETLNFSESWSYVTRSKVNISTSGAWYYREEIDGDFNDNFSYNLNVSKDWGWGNATLKITDNQTRNSSSSVNTSDTNYLPDITFNVPKWKLPWLGEIVYNSQFTNYEYRAITNNIVTTHYKGQRLANKFSKSVKFWEKNDMTLSTNNQLLYRHYWVDGIGSDFAALIEGINFQKKFSPALSTVIGINYTAKYGEVPDMFVTGFGDNLTDGGAVTNSWNWRLKTFNLNLSSGYNLTYQTFNPVNVSASWNPDAKGSFSFSSVYYLEDDRYYHRGLGYTTVYFLYLPKQNWRINMGVNYDFQSELWGERYLETQITQQLAQNWKIRFSARYSGLVGDFSVLNFDLTYNWHCRDLIFSYDYVEETYNLQLNFKAFPQAKIGTNMDATGLLNQ